MSFKFTNEGAEDHELAIARKNDGVTESFDELLALPEEEAMTKVTFVTAGLRIGGRDRLRHRRARAGRAHRGVLHPAGHERRDRRHRPAALHARHDPGVHGRLNAGSHATRKGAPVGAPSRCVWVRVEFGLLAGDELLDHAVGVVVVVLHGR